MAAKLQGTIHRQSLQQNFLVELEASGLDAC